LSFHLESVLKDRNQFQVLMIQLYGFKSEVFNCNSTETISVNVYTNTVFPNCWNCNYYNLEPRKHQIQSILEYDIP